MYVSSPKLISEYHCQGETPTTKRIDINQFISREIVFPSSYDVKIPSRPHEFDAQFKCVTYLKLIQK